MGLEWKRVSKWEKELMKTLHPAHNKMKKHCCKDTTQHYTREYKAWRNWSFSSILVVPFANYRCGNGYWMFWSLCLFIYKMGVLLVTNTVNMLSRRNTQQANNNVLASTYSLYPNTMNNNDSFDAIHWASHRHLWLRRRIRSKTGSAKD